MLVFEEFTIESQSLRRNPVHDPYRRKVHVIRYGADEGAPALIGLAGFFGSSDSFLSRSYMHQDFLTTLNKITKKRSKESFLIILPDTMTAFHGNQYLNSPAVGNYEDFIIKDLLPEIEKRYGKRNIGLFGKSSGGFGSYNLTVNNPGKIGGFIDVSGDAGFELCYFNGFGKSIQLILKHGLSGFFKLFSRKPNPGPDFLSTMNTIAMSAFYSPNPKSELLLDLPFDPTTGEFRDSVWKRWLRYDPARNISVNTDNLRDKKIILQTGNRDDFFINIGMSTMHAKLDSNGVKHTFQVTDATHMSLEFLYEKSIPELNEYLYER